MTLDEMKACVDLGVIFINSDGRITYTNDALHQAIGWSREDLIGNSLSVIMPASMRDAHTLGFSRFLYTEKPVIMNKPIQLKTVCKDGSEIEAEYFITAEKISGQWNFGATIRPLKK